MAIAKPIPKSGTCDVSTWGFSAEDVDDFSTVLEIALERIIEKAAQKYEHRIAKDLLAKLLSAAEENDVFVHLCDKDLKLHFPLRLEVESPYGPYEGNGMHYSVELKDVIRCEMEMSDRSGAVKLLGRLEEMIAELRIELGKMRLGDE